MVEKEWEAYRMAGRSTEQIPSGLFVYPTVTPPGYWKCLSWASLRLCRTNSFLRSTVLDQTGFPLVSALLVCETRSARFQLDSSKQRRRYFDLEMSILSDSTVNPYLMFSHNQNHRANDKYKKSDPISQIKFIFSSAANQFGSCFDSFWSHTSPRRQPNIKTTRKKKKESSKLKQNKRQRQAGRRKGAREKTRVHSVMEARSYRLASPCGIKSIEKLFFIFYFLLFS